MFQYNRDTQLKIESSAVLQTFLTSDRAVGRPGRNGGTSLIKQDVSGLLAYFIFRYGMYIAVIKAVPLPVNGVLTVSYETGHTH